MAWSCFIIIIIYLVCFDLTTPALAARARPGRKAPTPEAEALRGFLHSGYVTDFIPSIRYVIETWGSG